MRKNAFFEPDAVVLHPDDDEKLALAKDANGQYFGGGPRTGAYGVGDSTTSQAPIWRLPPIVTTSIIAGTILVGAFKLSAEVYWRQGITLEFTNSDSDDFQKNLITVRCELRAALAIPHPLGFCQVTGIS